MYYIFCLRYNIYLGIYGNEELFMKYIETKIFTNRRGSEEVIARLMAMGIDSATIEDPDEIYEIEKKENGYEWDYIDEKAYPVSDEYKVIVYSEDSLEGRTEVDKIREAMMKLKGDELEGKFGWDTTLGRLYVEDNVVDDEDWLDTWKEFFKPAKVTERIVIKPTWEEYSPAEDDLVIELDPGRAFGTGTHETTSGCLALMEKYMKDGDSVLDVGCGSGILSIGAALLGSRDILAIDIDPVAVDVTVENAELNGVSDLIRAEVGDLTKGVSFKADIVAANLMADLVMMLTRDVAKHLKDGGIYISSGILLEKEEPVTEVLHECGFEVIDVLRKGEWCAIAARLK